MGYSYPEQGYSQAPYSHHGDQGYGYGENYPGMYDQQPGEVRALENTTPMHTNMFQSTARLHIPLITVPSRPLYPRVIGCRELVSQSLPSKK